MKKSTRLSILFIIEAIVCGVLARVVNISNSKIDNLLVYPFVTLANKLFNISVKGNNFLAWLILIEVVLIPIVIMVVILIFKKFKPIHIMLPVLSIYLFYIIYSIINPTTLVSTIGKNGYYSIVDLENALCSVFYILLISYIVLMFIQRFKGASEKRIISYIEIIIIAVGLILVANSIYINYFESAKSYSSVYKEISPYGIDMKYTKIFYILKYIIEALPTILYVVMSIIGISILDNMKLDRFDEKVIKQTKLLSKISIISVIIMVMVNLGFNVLTLPYISKLYGDFRCFVVPVYFIVFSLGILLFSKYIEDTKKIKDDNDLFV